MIGLSRRAFGLGLLASLAAPAIVRAENIWIPPKKKIALIAKPPLRVYTSRKERWLHAWVYDINTETWLDYAAELNEQISKTPGPEYFLS